jgi:predicted metal-dependent hydrolase
MTGELSSVQFGTTRIDYAIRRTSRRKTVSIVVGRDASVVLAAPASVSVERLDQVVRGRAKWIASTVRNASESPPPSIAREFVSGETFLYAGRQHILRVVVSDTPSVALERGLLVVRTTRQQRKVQRESVQDQLVEWYRQRAEERLTDIVWEWSELSELRPSGVRLSSPQRRWGSCTHGGEVRLNWRIVGASKRVVEYVVAHELVHLRHRDHTAAFWRKLGAMMPDFEVRRAQLREIGPRLIW